MSKPSGIRVPPSKQLSIDDNVIKVIVGTTKTFMVHETLLTTRSEFFRRALNGNWSESDDRTVSLDEDEPAIFALYLNLIYRDEIPTHNNIAGDGSEFGQLAKLYVLCEKVQDRTGKNAVIEAILEKSCETTRRGNKVYPGSSPITRIYEGTPESSPARRLMVDLFVEHAGPGWLVDEKGKSRNYPAEFLFDVTMQFLERCKLPDWKSTEEEEAVKRYREDEPKDVKKEKVEDCPGVGVIDLTLLKKPS